LILMPSLGRWVGIGLYLGGSMINSNAL